MDDSFEDVLEIPPTKQPPPPKIELPKIIEIPDEEEIKEEIVLGLDVEITDETVIGCIIDEEGPAEEVAEEVFDIVEDQPLPPGGLPAFYRYSINLSSTPAKRGAWALRVRYTYSS